jgi:hypothetical protein
VGGDTTHPVQFAGQPVDVPASRFFRPSLAGSGRLYNILHRRRIRREMERAAKTGRLYHLWWHPHNFGRNTSLALQSLEELLLWYDHLADKYGMTSMNMSDVGQSMNMSDVGHLARSVGGAEASA